MESTTKAEPPLTEVNNNSTKENGQNSAEETNANTNANTSSAKATTLSGLRSGKRSIPSPITSAHAHTAADNRAMRRIIAEDPEWSLATVPLLTEMCVSHIVNNFAGRLLHFSLIWMSLYVLYKCNIKIISMSFKWLCCKDSFLHHYIEGIIFLS